MTSIFQKPWFLSIPEMKVQLKKPITMLMAISPIRMILLLMWSIVESSRKKDVQTVSNGSILKCITTKAKFMIIKIPSALQKKDGQLITMKIWIYIYFSVSSVIPNSETIPNKIKTIVEGTINRPQCLRGLKPFIAWKNI